MWAKNKKDTDSFLENSEQEEYNKANRCLKRRFKKDSTRLSRTNNNDPIEQVNYIENNIKKQQKYPGYRFNCSYIKVKHHDGMTWSAEYILQSLKKNLKDFDIFALQHVNSTEDHSSEITKIISNKTFSKLKLQSGFSKKKEGVFLWRTLATTTLVSLFLFMCILEFALSVLSGIIGGIITRVIEKQSHSFDMVIRNPALWIVVLGLIILLAIISIYILIGHPTRLYTEEDNLEKIKQKIHRPEYNKFIESIAYTLSKMALNRVVIIDNFERLDFITKDAIKKYFQLSSQMSDLKEYWVVFDVYYGDVFERWLSELEITGNIPEKVEDTKVFEQCHITKEEENRLREELGQQNNNNSSYREIKWICASNALKQVSSKLDEYLHFYPIANYRNQYLFLFLLSLTSEPEKFIFLLDNTNRIASSKTKYRPLIIKEFFDGAIPPLNNLRAYFSFIKDTFPEFLIIHRTTQGDGVRVLPEVRRVLESRKKDLALPSPKIGELFWILFWSSKLKQYYRSASVVRKYIYHLMRLDIYTIADFDSISKDLTQAIFHFYMETIDGCIETCIFENIVDSMSLT